jgi:hypothetical protein
VKVAPWLFGARTDLAAFTGSALLALGLVLLRRSLGWAPELPEWGWFAFVLGVDVAHVYATLFRTYLDGAELARHRLRYVGVPLVVYAASVALHLVSGATFFRVLAYLAVLHFVRQQVGWVALYRSRDDGTRIDKVVDDSAVYAATGYPLLYWHAHLGAKSFSWLMPGDFVDIQSAAARWLGPARVLWAAALALFFVRQLAVAVTEKRLTLGKSAVVATTALTWYVGIVGSSGDFDFTVTNVLTHGIPYMVLLFTYGRAAGRGEGTTTSTLGSALAARGALAFVGVLVGFALFEEAGWDRLVFHDHEWLFGATNVTLARGVAAFVVPLLALPQAVHYVLDGVLWRRKEPALRDLPSFLPRPGSPAPAPARVEWEPL